MQFGGCGASTTLRGEQIRIDLPAICQRSAVDLKSADTKTPGFAL